MALQSLAAHGIDTLLSTMDWTNHEAWQSCRRLGYIDLGLLWRWGWPFWMHTNAPREAKALGIHFGPQAYDSQNVAGAKSQFPPAEPVADE
jgi:hypothetical protein